MKKNVVILKNFDINFPQYLSFLMQIYLSFSLFLMNFKDVNKLYLVRFLNLYSHHQVNYRF